MATDNLLPPELRDTLRDIAGHLVAINGDLKIIREDQVKLRVEVAELRGKVSQLPTLLPLVGIMVTMLALALGGQAGILLLMKPGG